LGVYYHPADGNFPLSGPDIIYAIEVFGVTKKAAKQNKYLGKVMLQSSLINLIQELKKSRVIYPVFTETLFKLTVLLHKF
jgi:hypothetical protein